MLTLDLSALANLGNDFALQTQDWKDGAELTSMQKSIDARGQGFAEILDDGGIVQSIEDFAHERAGQYTDIVVLGIGGSALGPKTLRDALIAFDDPHRPTLHIMENVDPDYLREVTERLNLAKTLFIPITKSGGTPETLAQYFYFRQLVEEASLDFRRHFVVVTDPESGFLRERTAAEGIPSFPVPPNVGGRFSVLTAVGLLPAALMGIDIRELLEGAKDVRKAYQSENPQKNMCYLLAKVQYELSRRGVGSTVLMPYSAKLRTLADWYAQLLAESTGKINSDGKHVGLTPIPAVGVTDQHSQLQLFAQGPIDKLVAFVHIEKPNGDIEIPLRSTHEKVAFLEGVTFGQLLDAEFRGTRDSLTEGGRPVVTISVPHLDAKAVGALFFLFEGATAFLGEMMSIDAFDQPGVERSKVLTREYLSAKQH